MNVYSHRIADHERLLARAEDGHAAAIAVLDALTDELLALRDRGGLVAEIADDVEDRLRAIVRERAKDCDYHEERLGDLEGAALARGAR